MRKDVVEAVRRLGADNHLGGADISEVLAMPVSEAVSSSAMSRRTSRPRSPSLERLDDVGLCYSASASPLTTPVRLRSGSAQARHPTGREGAASSSRLRPPGLHRPTSMSCSPCSTGSSDAGSRSRHRAPPGCSWRHADWIIDLGPVAGHDGAGSSRGHAADLIAARSTLTASTCPPDLHLDATLPTCPPASYIGASACT